MSNSEKPDANYLLCYLLQATYRIERFEQLYRLWRDKNGVEADNHTKRGFLLPIIDDQLNELHKVLMDDVANGLEEAVGLRHLDWRAYEQAGDAS